ncbi:histone-lysine N-methyltransferase 2D [Teleopsis dalmanni]|uniref:histone-lysine N-methyltransferase 2D n=1 Tax=Teleopsis dalmanni TaxID=139649 RepID=UPI0018CF3C25|nr:histone-lysine N-methyltransferase 2D [Teleopsis dalmanni]
MISKLMSFMIVKVSSTAEVHNNKTSTIKSRNVKSYRPKFVNITTSTEATPRRRDHRKELITTDFTHEKLPALKLIRAKKRRFLRKMRAKTQQLQTLPPLLHQQQPQLQPQQQEQQLQPTQQYQQQYQQAEPQQPLQQQQIEEPQKQIQQQTQHQTTLQSQQQSEDSLEESHAIVGENNYLLERGNNSAHEQSAAYGTWRTKAIPTSQSPIELLPTAVPIVDLITPVALSNQSNEIRQTSANNAYQHHFYERLPKRISTMSPIKNELHDQIPRPPRLTSRNPSLLVRRQYLATPTTTTTENSLLNEAAPKPFHFPHNGPQPQEFKKATDSERSRINNIQDILQQLNLNGVTTKAPQLVMMPTGLHIAGSFKNLKSSGLMNFFRNKRNKNNMQIAFPMSIPMHMVGPPHTPFHNPLSQPYQRISMDQFYPFKPRSPQDINLLAMQQQIQTQRSKSKKKQKKMLAPSNLLLQHSNQLPFAADPYMQYPPQLFAINGAQKPKRVPFKVNLDIFPVLPPTKDYNVNPYNMDEAKLVPTTRPYTVLRNPFVDLYPYQSAAPNAVGTPVFPHMKLPPAPIAQASNMQISFPDQYTKYPPPQPQLQLQPQLQPQFQPQLQPHLQPQLPQQHHIVFPAANQQTPFIPSELIRTHQASATQALNQINPSNGQLMVHLNVFPKQKPSTNPFYNSAANINRNTNLDDCETIYPIEPRDQGVKDDKVTFPDEAEKATARSDNEDLHELVDFEHPIVAADMPVYPFARALVSNKLDSSASSPHYEFIDGPSNYNFNMSTNFDQAANEAKTASLFRLPVEDLIQFQVDDAL